MSRYDVEFRTTLTDKEKLKLNSDMNIQQQLDSMHRYLVYEKFPYHSVSVIHKINDLQFHVIFMNEVKPMVTEEIKGYIKANGFTFSYVTKNESKYFNL